MNTTAKKRNRVTVPGTVPIDLYVRNGKIRIDATELQQVVRRAVYDANRDFADILTYRHPEVTIRLKALLSGQDPLMALGANFTAKKRREAIEAIMLRAISVAMDQVLALEDRPLFAQR
jgi:hypothetical protein